MSMCMSMWYKHETGREEKLTQKYNKDNKT